MHAATTAAPPIRPSAAPAPGLLRRAAHERARWREALAGAVPALPARTLQLHLVARGHLAPEAVSGRFDAATRAALVAFQEEAGLAADGLPGAATADALLGGEAA